MQDTLQFLIRHGYALLFLGVFLEQTGFPVPSVPLLLGVGALAADGQFSFAAALLIALAASLPADAVWYELGKRRGYGVLRVLCRISLEADTCVRRTTNIFQRYGLGTLVVAKFDPGLSLVDPPMAGMLKMSTPRFVLLDGAGAALWATAYLLLGAVFRRQLEWIAAVVAYTGASLLAVVTLSFGGYLTWKWLDRRRYLRQLEMSRMEPEELWRRIQAGEEIV